MINSPFRKTRELAWRRPVEVGKLNAAAAMITGDHSFRAFAVKGTAPESDDHRCIVHEARWVQRPGGVFFEIRANRFLHHMVRFLVATMLDIAAGRRDTEMMTSLLESNDNHDAAPPAPPHALYLDTVEYPAELYLQAT